MKKTFANIRTLAALLIASAALAACSNDDGIVDNAQPAQQQAPQVYTLTLQAGKADNAQTRALALDGTKLVAKWVAGEQVTVKRGDDELGTLSVKEGSVSADGQTCTFTGTLTGNIATDDVLTLTYHPVASLYAYASQTGTLESASGYDVATASVTVTAVDNGTNTITAGTAEFETQTAMLKITMQDGSDNALNATSLKISAVGIDIFTFGPIAEATYTANGDGVLYFALPSAATVAAAKSLPTAAFAILPVTFTATVGSDTYTAAKTGYPFAAGTYYTTTLTMAKPYTLISAATTSDYGKVVCAAGHLHDAKTAVPAGCTAVGILGKVTETGHGLILALKNATSQTWNTINGWASASYAGTTLKVLPDDAARGTNLTSYTTLGETTVSNWAVAQKSDYEAIFTNLGSTKNSGGMTYDNNVNAYITTGVGGTAMAGDYWSATQDDDYDAWYFIESYCWYDDYNTSTYYVRPVLGF